MPECTHELPNHPGNRFPPALGLQFRPPHQGVSAIVGAATTYRWRRTRPGPVRLP